MLVIGKYRRLETGEVAGQLGGEGLLDIGWANFTGQRLLYYSPACITYVDRAV